MRYETNCRQIAGTVSALAAGFALLLVFGCSSAAKSDSSSAQDTSDAGAHIDVGCMLGQVEKPAEAFYYSYKYADDSRAEDREADVTPDAVDIVIKDNSGSHSFHGMRTDEQSWNRALLDLSSLTFTGMTGRLAGIDGSSAIVSKGADPVNGYPATKYSIDTGGASSSDKQTFATLFGPGSYDRGTVWMGQDGCAVKLVLDEGLTQTSGSVEKRHFEIARTKK